jgi:hypothetical protein
VMKNRNYYMCLVLAEPWITTEYAVSRSYGELETTIRPSHRHCKTGRLLLKTTIFETTIFEDDNCGLYSNRQQIAQIVLVIG